MERLSTLSPALKVRIRDDWWLVASAAGRNSQGLKASLSIWQGETPYDPETILVDNGTIRRAYAEMLCARVRAFSLAAAESVLMQMYQQAEGALRAKPRKPTSTASAAPGPPAHAYQETPHGIVWCKKTIEGTVDVPLTNFTARIVGDVVHDDGAEPVRHWEIQAARNGWSTTCTIDAQSFAGMSWVAAHLGAKAMIMPGVTLRDHARAAIQCFSETVTPRTIYGHTGWRDVDGTWVYLHGGGAIGPKGAVATVEVATTESLTRYQLSLPEDANALQDACTHSLTLLEVGSDHLTYPLYGALWRTCLGGSDFALHLTGATGQGKSALAALLQQHWGAGMDAMHLPGSWSSTGNALEALAFTLKDALLVIDDFCPAGSPADIARAHKDADRVLRAQGNWSGRGRLRADGTLRPPKPPRGVICSTGEDIPHGQSLRARMLILNVEAGDLDWPLLTACQRHASAGAFATALGGFVHWLSPHYALMCSAARREIETLRSLVTQYGHRRTATIIAQMLWGWQHVLTDGTWHVHYQDKKDLDRVKAQAPGREQDPWIKHPLEMWCKTALKNVAKYCPLSGALQTTLEADDQAEEALKTVTPEQAQRNIAEMFDRHDGNPEPQEG